MTIISITFSLIILNIIWCYIKRCFCYFDDGLEVLFLLCLLCLHRQTLPNKNMHLLFVFINNNKIFEEFATSLARTLSAVEKNPG